jgi:hypothetical protein
MRYEVTTQKQLDDAIRKAGAADVIVCLGGTWTSPLKIKDAVKATVRADGSSTVRADGSSTVRADGSSTVRAYGSSTVRAYGSSTVRADGSSTVWAYGSSTVRAGRYVPVQNAHDSDAKITGGVLIQLPKRDEWTTDEWLDAGGIDADTDGVVVLFKAVDDDWSTSNARAKSIFYRPGDEPAAPDWNPTPDCGGGLHVSPAPFVAREYNWGASRYVGVPVLASDLVVIDGTKAKAPRAAGPVFEVDVRGNRVETQEAEV